MKIDKVVFSCSEEFSPFWNIQSLIWKEKLGIEPVCILWGDIKNTNMKDTYGEIIEKKYNPDMVKSFQLTWSKFYHTQTEPETTWMIGDIDLLPLQKEWFIDKIEELPDDVYTHLAYAAMSGSKPLQCEGGLTAYYHVAKGKTYTKGLGLDECSFEEQVERVINDKDRRFGRPTSQEHIKNYNEWSERHGYQPYITPENDDSELQFWLADEKYSTWRLKRATGCEDKSPALPFQEDKKIEFINHITLDFSWDDELKGLVDRIDRCEFRSPNYTNWNIDKLISHGYIDMHCWRPYDEQEDSMLKIISACWGDEVQEKYEHLMGELNV